MRIKKNPFRHLSLIAPFILLISLFALPALAAGEVDTSFVASAFIRTREKIQTTLVQPDGKIIIGGDFEVVGKYSRKHIARLNADGSVDSTFNPVELRDVYAYEGYVSHLALQSDGKILVGGKFAIEGIGNQGLIRLNPDGSLDAVFANKSAVSSIRTLYDLIVTPDDKILYSADSGGAGRLNRDGDLEASANVILRNLSLQADGKIVAYNPNSFQIVRYNQDFTLDNTFQTPSISNSVLDIELQADGKILIGGDLSAVNNFPFVRIARLNANGTIDSSFNVGTAGPNYTVRNIEIQTDGKILIGGDFTAVNGAAANKVARLNPADGSLDATFNSGINADVSVYDLDIQPNGKIVTASDPVFRLNADGSVDASFVSPAVGDPGSVRATFVQPDNKILVGGYFTMANEKTIRHLARFNADGTVDNSFNQNYLPENGTILAIAVQPDGKIIAGGDGFGGAVRLNPDGSFDKLLYTGFIAYDIKIQTDGKILVSGVGYVNRFNADGSADASFTSVNVNGRVTGVAIQPDGKILFVGIFSQVNGVNRNRIARLNTNGTLDASFNPPGGPNADVYDIALLADGKILIAGDFTGVNFDTTKKYLARLNSDGSLDAGFTPVINIRPGVIRLQPDGKILLGGLSIPDSGFPTTGKITRVNPDGTLDSTFNNSIAIDQIVNDISLQSDGRIILGGSFTRVGGVSNLGVARLLNSSAGGAAPFDFDGDGKTDLSIFRPASGEWWVNQSSNGGNFAVGFGSSTDKLVPGDFTGDGKTDIAFWRPSTGSWFILRSEDGSFYSFPFGAAGDIPVVGDFDADGKDDVAVFRPSDTNWYIRRSSDGGTTIQQFGATGDVPVAADYDGDGKADLAIFRPSAGQWWILRSTAGLIAFQFGNNADKPVVGDYTGDGKTDVAFFRPSTGEWFVLRSENQTYYSFPFGAAGDVPAPGDYDGDGKFDATVFRPSTATWYAQRTTAGVLIQSFGQNGDLPVPNAFVP